jgi:pSer/pThr/pTyr-binding forkhead associated (FHA) protein
VRVVVDHVAGTRRGQRQEFSADIRVRFGRHPDCEVSFDPHRDIDASSRHAELRPRAARGPDSNAASHGARPDDAGGWVLVDVGSSNGTYVEGRRITEAPISQAMPVSVQFGPGGPRIRLFVGDDAAIERLPPPPIERARPPWLWPAIGAAVVLAAVLVMMRC